MRKLEENVKFERYCGKYRNGMKRVDVWWTSWESAVIGDFGGVLNYFGNIGRFSRRNVD